MPEITDSQHREYAQYQALGTPEEIKKTQGDLEKAKKEGAERRTENAALKTENEALKAKVPDGAVILTGDEAAAYAAVQTAGLTLAQVDAGLKERDTLKAAVAAREHEDAWRETIKGEGWADVDGALKALSGMKDFEALRPELMETEVEVTANGKTERVKKKVGFVTPEGGTAKRAGEWLKEVNPLLHTAVSASKGNGTTFRESGPTVTTTSPAGSGKAALEAAKEANKKRAEAGNALRPAATT